ncbi:MAG TPA: hypothetical protein DEQ28_07725 [Clostridiales bacterium]|nr:hypothetical protein [Clostridiales bacterium]
MTEAIRKLAQRIGAENSDVKETVLFGSLAQRRGVPGSDADLLIVLWKDGRPFPDRIGPWLAKVNLDFPVVRPNSDTLRRAAPSTRVPQLS